MKLNAFFLLAAGAVATSAANINASSPVAAAQPRVVQVISELRLECMEGQDDCGVSAVRRVAKESRNACVLAGLMQFDAGEAWNEALVAAVEQQGRKAVPCLLHFREHPIRVETVHICTGCGGPFPWRIGHAERRNRYNPVLQRITGLKAPWLDSAVARRVEELVAALPAASGEETTRQDLSRWYAAIEAYREDNSPEADAALAAAIDFAGEFVDDIELEICMRGPRMVEVLTRFQRDPQFAPKVDEQAGAYERFWRFQEMIDAAKGGR